MSVKKDRVVLVQPAKCRAATMAVRAIAVILVLAVAAAANTPAKPAPIVVTQQQARIDTIHRVAPSVVCIHNSEHRGGGSGVIIDPEGYGLTNYHVVRGMMNTRRGWGGLTGGRLFELEVLGIDPTGDVAMFRLHGDEPFPFVRLGDSDAVEVGDPVIAMGDPFVLSEDFSPTVTMGMVTGVHRYQWGVGNNLIYSDCIQVDASINPGSSGGPLFNANGDVIGINGRISVNTRGRYNVGFGYAITSNQIARFIPALRAGLLARHGTLQITVIEDEGLRVADVAPEGAADRAGVRIGDALRAIDGLAINSANHFVSVMGTYPENRNVLVEVLRDGHARQFVARLDPVDPDMRGKFSSDGTANTREVQRVLSAFQHTVRSHPIASDHSVRLTGTVRQVNDKSGIGHRFVAVLRSGEATTLHKYDTHQGQDNAAGARAISEIRYDRASAQQRIRADQDWFHLPATERMIYTALYMVERILLEPLDVLDLSEVHLVGGDALFEKVDDVYQTPPLETLVILWPVDATTHARLAFDRQSHRLVQAVVADVTSGSTAEIRFRGKLADAAFAAPASMEISGAGLFRRYDSHGVTIE